MKADPNRILRDTSQVVAGVFTQVENAKDAICDLSSAGFSASQIHVANAHRGQSKVGSAEHTLFWRLGKAFEDDMHRQGASQIAGETPSLPRTLRYTEVDLHEALSQIGVADDRIKLIADEIRDGVLLLVNAGTQTANAHEIIERNNGTIRTDTVTEAAR